MKKIFTLIAAALVAVGANAQWTPSESDVFSVVGDASVAGSAGSWDVAYTGSEMTANGDGSYSLTREGVVLEPGNKEFKVVQNHTWTSDDAVTAGGYANQGALAKAENIRNWGDGVIGDNGMPGNYTWNGVDEAATYTITITITPDDDMLNTPSVTATRTGDAPEITHTWSAIGSPAEFFGGEWDTELDATGANDMTLIDDPDNEYDQKYVLERTLNVEAPLNFSFKVRMDHDWGTSYPKENYNYTGTLSGTVKYVITYDPADDNAVAVTEAEGDPNDVDGINAVKSVNNEKNDNRIFNLAGQQVDKTFKGVVISNGRKYIQK